MYQINIKRKRQRTWKGTSSSTGCLCSSHTLLSRCSLNIISYIMIFMPIMSYPDNHNHEMRIFSTAIVKHGDGPLLGNNVFTLARRGRGAVAVEERKRFPAPAVCHSSHRLCISSAHHQTASSLRRVEIAETTVEEAPQKRGHRRNGAHQYLPAARRL